MAALCVDLLRPRPRLPERAWASGDVKLAGLLGLYLGWLGWGALLIGGFGGFLHRRRSAARAVVAGRATRTTAIPFAPVHDRRRRPRPVRRRTDHPLVRLAAARLSDLAHPRRSLTVPAATHIGLDIGSTSIRAVEATRTKDRPVINNFGQALLPAARSSAASSRTTRR